MIVLAVLAGVLLLVSVHDAIRRPVLRRVALRNLTRRAGEATLVIVGSALGTAIIAGAFIVGDTFDNSIRDIARTDLGPIDQIVFFNDPADLDDAVAAVRGTEPIDGVDGVAGVLRTRVAIATTDNEPRAEPDAAITEGDFDELRDLGTDISGLADAGATPAGDEIVLDRELADELEVEPGDAVLVYAYGTATEFEIRTIVPSFGIAGRGDAFVAPGTLSGLSGGAGPDVAPPSAQVLVSNDGGIFDSTGNVSAVERETERRLVAAGLPVDQYDAKADLLADAEEEGSEITEIFTAIGGFSVLAGVLLLVNLFVMLAEERKTALGVLRAIGWRRGHLVRGFVLEGAAYAIIAATLGAVLGIAVGWVIVRATASIFADTGTDFDLRLAIEPSSLLTAALAGLVISLLVVWITSWRISRLNIIRAIRDLPEPPSSQRRRRSLVFGLLGVIGGLLLTFVVGVGGEDPTALLVGLGVALFGALPLVARLFPVGSKVPAVAIGVAVVAWSVASFGLFPDITEDPPIHVFLLQGVLMVAGSVAVTSSLGTWWARTASRLGASDPATQLGLAYPVARRFRTSVSLAMFALIVFSLTFLAVLTRAFGDQTEAFVAESSGGYDAVVSSNAANPVAGDDLAATDGVDDVTTLLRGSARFSTPSDPASLDDPEFWRVSGVDDSFVALGGAPVLDARSPEYVDDVALFADLATRPDAVVVASWFLGDDGSEPQIGDAVTMFGPTGEATELEIVGLMENDWAFGGAFLSADLVRDALPGQYAASEHYVSFAADAGDDRVVATINGRHVEHGADTETFSTLVGNEVREQQGFFNLLSGYLALGLLIGVAGLAVVMVRAVRERRRQVGMLRAMGMPTPAVRRMFLTEGGFVAFQGVVSGAALGLLSSYQLLTRSNTFEIELGFAVPIVALGAIVAVPLVASALASAIPAGRAAHLAPSEALRLGD